MLISLEVGGVFGLESFLYFVFVLCFDFGIASLLRFVPMCPKEVNSLFGGICVFLEERFRNISRNAFLVGARQWVR